MAAARSSVRAWTTRTMRSSANISWISEGRRVPPEPESGPQAVGRGHTTSPLGASVSSCIKQKK